TNVGGASVEQRLRRNSADRHRDVGQGFVAPRRGDHDVTGVDRLLLFGLVLNSRSFGGSAFGRLRTLLVGVGVRLRSGLREAWSRQNEQASRKQPRGLADHVSLPCWAHASAQSGERLIRNCTQRKRARSLRHQNAAALQQIGNSNVSKRRARRLEYPGSSPGYSRAVTWAPAPSASCGLPC